MSAYIHACDHEEHQILSASEATAFAAQFWDKKTHPTKASQQEFLATCIDVDLEQNVKPAFRVGTGKEPQVAGLAKAEKICS